MPRMSQGTKSPRSKNENERTWGAFRVEQRKLTELKTHPKQAQYCKARNQAQIERLAELIKNNYLAPIEITPDNVIIAGHGRLEACQYLGWKKVDVIVRRDLAAQGPEAIEARLIAENQERQQFDRLQRARNAKRLFELARQKPADDPQRPKGTVRDVVGAQLGVSGRTLDRWMRVLDTPEPVQIAFTDGQLPLVLAASIGSMAPQIRQKIADAIKSGEQPKQAVARFLPGATAGAKCPYDVLDKLLTGARRRLGELEPLVGQIKSLAPGHLAEVQRHHAVMERLLRKRAPGKNRTRRNAKTLANSTDLDDDELELNLDEEE